VSFEKPDIVDMVFLLPPLFGALWGARYTRDTTVRERVTTYVTSAVMGTIFGAAVAEYWHFGPYVMSGLMFTTAALGNEALAYCVALLRQGATDPTGWLRKVVDAVLGRRAE
jgi:hypothetical protein